MSPDWHQCTWAFKKMNFPVTWRTILDDKGFFDPVFSSGSSSSSDSESSIDEEKKGEKKHHKNHLIKKRWQRKLWVWAQK